MCIPTTIIADTSCVMEYIIRLDNDDAEDVTQVAVGEGLFEEAFAFHQKLDQQKVIEGALEHGGGSAFFELVLKSLKFARNKVKEIHVVDTEIIYATDWA